MGWAADGSLFTVCGGGGHTGITEVVRGHIGIGTKVVTLYSELVV